jgi:outer membrane protein OmpA-like peptidoglycan-associated protein
MTIRSDARLACCILLLGAANACGAASMESIRTTWPELGLDASLNSKISQQQVEQGSNLLMTIRAEDEASVAIVLVSAEDKQGRVLTLNRDDDKVTRGTPLTYPDLNSGETFYANLPVGKAYAYVVASREPLFKKGEFGSLQSVDPIAARLSAAGSAVAIHRLPFTVTASEVKEFVTEADFVRFFGEATRDVVNPSQGFPIEFETGSANITAWGKKQLDVVGKGMNNGELMGKAFRLEGHTDDVGTPEFNMELSRRRAQSVQEYLMLQGVSVKRLGTLALGETAPIQTGDSDGARQRNRRVEIRRLDR